MIVFMKEKDFLKHKKSLVEPKDYVIGDATDETTGELSKFAHSTSLDGLKPPKPLVRAIMADSVKLDPDKVDKMGKRFFKSPEFLNAAMGLAFSQAKSDLNYFIVFKNKDFKAYGKKIYKKFKELFPTSDDIFFLLKDTNDKILSKKISEESRRELNKAAQKVSDKLDKEEKEKKHDKKKKKKDKDKKKKKKKNKFLFAD